MIANKILFHPRDAMFMSKSKFILSWVAPRSALGITLTPHSVMVSTALMTLIDDTVKRRYNKKRVVQLSLPGAGKSLNMEYIGPKKFLDEMFGNRINDSNGRRPSLVRSLSTSMKMKGYTR